MNVGVLILSSHIYREVNSCTDKLANHGYGVTSSFWCDVLPTFISQDIFRDRVGLSNYHFP